MIPVAIDTLVVGIPPSPSVIVLRPVGDTNPAGNVLPIWIGPTEAASIGLALEGSQGERPMTHDLLTSFLAAMNAKLEHVIIHAVEGTTFYATIVLNKRGVCVNVDARPSDSVALAVREQAPIYVEEEVMSLAAFPAALNPAGTKAIEVDEFHNFIENVSPEDFRVEGIDSRG